MTSALANEDIESLIEEGCIVHPSDVIRLTSLALKIEKRPDFRLSTLPRVALCGGVLFVQPTIAQDIYLDELCQVFSGDIGTMLALEAYVLAHRDKDWSKPPRFPRLFAYRCARWIRKNLGTECATKVRSAIDYCKYGCNPIDGEFPVYMADETFAKWYSDGGPKSAALKKYMEACAYGIPSAAALRATSPQLAAMIERAAILGDNSIGDEEKQATAEYFATLQEIKEKAYAERDAKRKAEEAIKDNG